ncbi:MAG: efflux RND transporter permease subunit [Polyangiales bacterium]
MNKLVAIALSRPYTFVVLAILITLYGGKSALDTPTDVFPNVKIPVVAIIWSYAGMLPEDVSGRITYFYERALTSTVEGIARLESQSYYGSSMTKVFLQPGADLAATEADIASISQTVTNALPPDISPPMVMRLEASSVPVAMLQVTSDTLSPADLYNLSIARIRPELVTIPGAILPHPYGGKPKQLLISLDQQKLLARHLTAKDVHDALNKQNLVLPAGDQKIKSLDWMVQTNASPLKVADFNNIPIKRVGDATVYLRDVGDATLAGPPQTNAVLVDGKQAVSIVVMKSGEASTLDVVNGIKEAIPKIKRSIPEGVDIKILNDASEFVKVPVEEVLIETLIAAALTGLVVLLFLGSWRATVIIATSIPLSILTAIICLNWLGESINIMTLGGLALAVGILVDNATVMIENIDTHIAMKKPLETAIIDGANQILIPTLVATLCIAIVWLPLFGLTGVSGYLFKPMAEAVMLAVLASFALSRTLVPTMAKYLLRGHEEEEHSDRPTRRENRLVRFQKSFERGFETFRDKYVNVLELAISRRRIFIPVFLLVAGASCVLFYFNGTEFFPEVKTSALQLHMRAPLGTRIETASRIASLVSNDIERMLPGEVEGIVSNCGLPVGPHNLAFIPTPTIGSQDCDLTIALTNEKAPVWDFRRALRKGLKERYPGTEFTFQPADLTAKILNFGSPAPIDVRVKGMDMAENYGFVRQLAGQLKKIPGATDVTIQQTMRTPTLLVEGNRTLGLGVGLLAEHLGLNMLLATSGSQQIDQRYWLDHKTGLSYQVNVYTPQPWLSSIDQLLTLPIHRPEEEADRPPQLLGNVAKVSAEGTPGVVTHEGIQPVFDIYVSAEGRDLGGVLADVQKISEEAKSSMPRSAALRVTGQAETMHTAYVELLTGLVAAIILVYLLIVVNFQSWLDPFIIITALPGAVAGVAWALFIANTYISVPALTGAIIIVGVATANSILVVAYARERLEMHHDAFRAAVEAGRARIRPVLMTASAMIFGMLPMSMGNSQNAPLGRAVIGGLLFATFATLFFVPTIYAVVYKNRTVHQQQAVA